MSPNELADYTYRVLRGDKFPRQVEYARSIFPLVTANMPTEVDPHLVTFSSYMVRALFQAFSVSTQITGHPKGLVVILLPDKCSVAVSSLMFAYSKYVGWGCRLSTAPDLARRQIASWGGDRVEHEDIILGTETEGVFYDYRLLKGIQSMLSSVDLSTQAVILFSSQEPPAEIICGADSHKSLIPSEVLPTVIDIPELVKEATNERLGRDDRSAKSGPVSREHETSGSSS